MANQGTTSFDSVELGGNISAPNHAFPKYILGTIAYSAFGTTSATTGTAPITGTIPAGATFLRSVLPSLTGFSGTPNASATLQIGDGTTANRYGGTIDVFGTAATSATGKDMGTPLATAVYHTAAKQPVATLTAGSLIGSVTAGQAVVKMYYFD